MRLRSLLLVLAGLALGLWIAWPAGSGAPEIEDRAEGGEARTAPAMLDHEAEGAEARDGVPKLGTARERPPELEETRITVIGADQKEIARVPVRITYAHAPGQARYEFADDDGRVVVKGINLDGSVTVEALARWVDPRAGRKPRVIGRLSITEREHHLPVAVTMPIDVRVEDAETGRPLPHARLLRAYPTRRDKEPPAWFDPKQPVALPGFRAYVGFRVDPRSVDEHVVWDDSKWYDRISRYADRLVAIFPARRQARVHVRVREHDGTPTQDAVLSGFATASRHVTKKLDYVPDGAGFHVRGIPFFRDEPLCVLVTRPPKEGDMKDSAEDDCCIEEEVEDADFDVEGSPVEEFPGAAIGTGRLPPVWEDLCIVTAVFPEDREELVLWGQDGTMMFGGGWGSSYRPAAGRLEVTVLRADGTPAVGAYVYVKSTSSSSRRHGAVVDTRGRAVIPEAPSGARDVFLEEPGLVRTILRADIAAGKTTRVTLRESVGGTLRIRVVDPDDNPLPYAELRWPELAHWADVKDGVQRIDCFTDVRGRRTLRRFPARRWTIKARYGSRTGEARVEVVDGRTTEATIRLEPRKP